MASFQLLSKEMALATLLRSLPLGDAAAPTVKALFGSNAGHDDNVVVEDTEPSNKSFSDPSTWASALPKLQKYFDECLAENKGAEAFWDALQKCSSDRKPHQKLVAVFFDRIRLGCVQSACVCLAWFTLRGGMQGLDGANSVLLCEIFGVLKLTRISALVDPHRHTLGDGAEGGAAIEQFLSGVNDFVQRQKDVASGPALMLCDLLVQLFSAVERLRHLFSSDAQAPFSSIYSKS